MQKIFITKNEAVSEIVDKILKAQDSEVMLVVPRSAAISGDSENFSIIKRAAETEGKQVGIESVDEDALRYAEENDLAAVHPLFAGAKGRVLSDIVHAGGNKSPMREVVVAKPVKTAAKRSSKMAKEEAVEDESEKVFHKIPVPHEEPVEYESTPVERNSYSDEEPTRSHRGRKVAIALVAVLVIVAGGAWGVGKVFGRATVSLEFKKVPWQYTGQVTIRTTDTTANAIAKSLPGEIFTDHRNMTNLFPASGRTSTPTKATGKITIYNNFSTATQSLVATTRFQTSDGKIVRLVNTVTVPGATSSGGKLQASTIEADVVADQAGADYNIGPTPKLTIPGFQGTPKYDGFYGVITNALTGGSTGEKAFATDADITAAKDRTREMLQASLATGALRNQPGDFTVVDGASQLTVTKLTVVSSTTEADKFGVFGEGDIKAIAFREGDMKSIMETLAQASSADMVLKDLSITYSNPIPDFDKGTLVVTVDAKGTLTGDFNEDAVKESLIGKKVGDAKIDLLKMPNLSHARISLWPLWISQIPAKIGRITVESN